MGSREKKKSRGYIRVPGLYSLAVPAFQRLDVAICWINRYSLDNSIGFDRGYLSTGQ